MRHILGWILLGLCPIPAPAQDAPPASQYGFLPPEIYKLDFDINNLLLRDVNADGKLDIVVVNNRSHRIDVLQQREGPGDRAGIPFPAEVNEIVSDWRLKQRKIPMTRPVGSLELADVNHDGRPDLVYIGDPPGLYVEYQEKDGRFARRRSFEKPDAQRRPWSVDVGDLNRDGRNDVVFVGNENLYVALQKSDGTIEEPASYRLSEGGAGLVRIIDMNGDGLSDIVYLSEDSEFPVRIRFQNQNGRPGPERRMRIDEPLGISYANVDGKPGQELLAISKLSHRLLIYSLTKADRDEDAPTSQIVVYPFERSGSSSRADVVTADFDGDKRPDVVVSDSNAARLLLFRQREEEGLDLGQSFPGMLGVVALRAADIDADGRFELFSLSPREKAIAMSRFQDNRLTFPQTLPSQDEPVVMELLGGGPNLRLVYVARQRDPKTQTDRFIMRMLRPEAIGGKWNWTSAAIGDERERKLELRGSPSDLRAVDANGDGQLDLLLCFEFDPPELWLSERTKGFAPAAEASRGVLSGVTPADVFFGSLLGPDPALVVAQSSFVRRVQLGNDGNWRVLDQYHATDTSGRVTGVAALDLDGDQQVELAIYDRNSRTVVFLKVRNGMFQRWKQLKAGVFDLRGMRAADFNNDGKSDLLLYDSDKMGIAYTGIDDLELRQIAAYETDIRGGELFDMVPGDLNGDRQLDILLVEPIRHHLEIVAVLPDLRLQRAIVWPVFEEKTFRRPNPSPEPREAVIGDLNGDGLEDIAVVVHDRVLVYLQDGGTSAEKTAAKAEK
jgi:hypothetical protein